MMKSNILLKTAVGIGCLVVLSGCAKSTSDNAIHKELSKQTLFTAQSWASDSGVSSNQAIAYVDWLSSFNDPLLNKLVLEAIQNNQELLAASYNVEKANEVASQAGAGLKTQGNISVSSSTSGQGGNSSTTQSISGQLSWEIDLWGRISAGQKAAVTSAKAAQADYKSAQHSLAASVSKAYFIAIEAELQEQVMQETVTSIEDTYRIVEIQFENGMVSAQDKSLALSDLSSSREQLTALGASKRDALRALEILLGRYPASSVDIGEQLPPLPTMPSVGVPSDVLERRPDMVANELRVVSAFSSTYQAEAARFPTFSLTSSVGSSSNQLSSISSLSDLVWQLAGNVLMPILDGGARESQVKVANIEQKQALASYSQAALTAFNEVETNLDLAASLKARNEDLLVALTEAKKALTIAKLRYEEGEISLVDLLTVQQRVLAAQSNQLSIQRLSLAQRVNLYLALGGNWF
ncbi:efflux transporter outer membrane subunit [Vibrio sp. RC27]